MIVGVEIELLHELPGRCRRFGEFLQLASRIEIVVAVLRLVVAPPLLRVSPVQPHVVEAFHVGQVVLADGEAELRLVDLDPGGAEGVQQREGVGDLVAPGLVAELDCDRVFREGAEQAGEIVARRGAILEAGGKLRQQRTEPPARRQRVDAAAEGVDVGVVGPRQRVEQRRPGCGFTR
jgi:hypothetical protein